MYKLFGNLIIITLILTILSVFMSYTKSQKLKPLTTYKEWNVENQKLTDKISRTKVRDALHQILFELPTEAFNNLEFISIETIDPTFEIVSMRIKDGRLFHIGYFNNEGYFKTLIKEVRHGE